MFCILLIMSFCNCHCELLLDVENKGLLIPDSYNEITDIHHIMDLQYKIMVMILVVEHATRLGDIWHWRMRSWRHQTVELQTVLVLSVAVCPPLALTQETHSRRRRHQFCQEGLWDVGWPTTHHGEILPILAACKAGYCAAADPSISSQTCSIGARFGGMGSHSITRISWRLRKSMTTRATWGLVLSCCKVMTSNEGQSVLSEDLVPLPLSIQIALQDDKCSSSMCHNDPHTMTLPPPQWRCGSVLKYDDRHFVVPQSHQDENKIHRGRVQLPTVQDPLSGGFVTIVAMLDGVEAAIMAEDRVCESRMPCARRRFRTVLHWYDAVRGWSRQWLREFDSDWANARECKSCLSDVTRGRPERDRLCANPVSW